MHWWQCWRVPKHHSSHQTAPHTRCKRFTLQARRRQACCGGPPGKASWCSLAVTQSFMALVLWLLALGFVLLVAAYASWAAVAYALDAAAGGVQGASADAVASAQVAVDRANKLLADLSQQYQAGIAQVWAGLVCGLVFGWGEERINAGGGATQGMCSSVGTPRPACPYFSAY